MSLVDPSRYRSAAELCRKKARSFSDASEWVRFSQKWEKLAQAPRRWLRAHERHHGCFCPGSSLADLLIASTLAIAGIAMTALPWWVVTSTLAAAACFAIMLDFVNNAPHRRRFGTRQCCRAPSKFRTPWSNAMSACPRTAASCSASAFIWAAWSRRDGDLMG